MSNSDPFSYAVKCVGYLANPDGSPIPDGIYEITFRLFESASADQPKWTEKQDSVVVRQGEFVTLLGEGEPLSADLVKTAPYLEAQVGNEKSGARQQLEFTTQKSQTVQTPWQSEVTASFATQAGVNPLQALPSLGSITPSSPTRVARLRINGYPMSVAVSNTYAFVAGNHSTPDGTHSYLQIIDITDPANPKAVSSLTFDSSDPLEGALGVVVSDKYAYVSTLNPGPNSGSLQIVDISDPFHPFLAGSLHLETGAFHQAIKVSGDFVYFGSFGRVHIIDVSKPNSPTYVATAGVEGARVCTDLATAGVLVYALLGDNLTVIDVSTPTRPVIRGQTFVRLGCRSISISGTYAYVLSGATQEMLVVCDIRNPDEPQLIGELLGFAESYGSHGKIAASGRFAYVVSLVPELLEIFDVGDPSHPTFIYPNLAEFIVSGNYYLRNLAVSGNHVYVVEADIPGTFDVIELPAGLY